MSVKVDKTETKTKEKFAIMNHSPISEFVAEDYYPIMNELTGSDTIVLVNKTDKQCFFLNGKIAENFVERDNSYEKKNGKPLKATVFKVHFFDAESDFLKDGKPVSYKGIQVIEVISQKENYVKYDA